MTSFAPALLSSARRLLVLSVVAGLLTACSSGSKRPEPTPLAPVTPLVPASLAWNASIGPVDAWMTPAIQGSTLFLANAAGAVTALNAATGQTLWRLEVGEPLSAAVGSDGQIAAVVTRSNELVALQ